MANQMTLVSERALRLTGDLTQADPQLSYSRLEPVNPLDVAQDVRHEAGGLPYRTGVGPYVLARDIYHASDSQPRLTTPDLIKTADNALHYGDIDGMVEAAGAAYPAGSGRGAAKVSPDYGPCSLQHDGKTY